MQHALDRSRQGRLVGVAGEVRRPPRGALAVLPALALVAACVASPRRGPVIPSGSPAPPPAVPSPGGGSEPGARPAGPTGGAPVAARPDAVAPGGGAPPAAGPPPSAATATVAGACDRPTGQVSSAGADVGGGYRALDVRRITWWESDPEGGHSAYEIYPSGYYHFSGRPSCCGYRPARASGWYRYRRVATVERLFDRAAVSVALAQAYPELLRDAEEDEGDGFRMHGGGGIEAGGRSYPWQVFSLGDDLEPDLEPLGTEREPADLGRPRVTPKFLANLRVLRALAQRRTDCVHDFSREEVALAVAALRAEARNDRSTDLFEFGGAVLTATRVEALDLVAGLLGDPAFETDRVIGALGSHGAAARPYVSAIADRAREGDGRLIAAARALGQIGGEEARARLRRDLVPLLARAPREPNLQIYYRAQFATALATLDMPEATQALEREVLPWLRQRLDEELGRPDPAFHDVASLVEALRPSLGADFFEARLPAVLERVFATPRDDGHSLVFQFLWSLYPGPGCPARLRRVLEATTGVTRQRAQEVLDRRCVP